MPTVKETLDGLAVEERRRLLYSFENGLSQFVKCSDGTFIGVNINQKSFPNLIVEVAVGKWTVGKVK